MGFPGGSGGKESTCNAGNLGLIPGFERSPGEGDGYLFQYSCLENSVDRGAWQAAVHGVAKELDTTEPHIHVVYSLLMVAFSFSITKLRFLHVFFIT